MSFAQVEGMFIVYHFQLFTLTQLRIVKEQKFSRKLSFNQKQSEGQHQHSLSLDPSYISDRSYRRMVEVEGDPPELVQISGTQNSFLLTLLERQPVAVVVQP